MANDYIVKKGDTLEKISKMFDISIADLAIQNNIKDPDIIHVGQVITLREPASVYIVQSGDTLTRIAAANSTTVDAIMSDNPKIRNADLISVGQSIVIPKRQGEGQSGGENGAPHHVALTEKDIVDIKKTLQTEWVQTAGDEQAKGIVDTIINRLASNHWGSTIAQVVNSRNQFSDINGPVSRRQGRSSVDQFAISKVSKRVDAFANRYLTDRADGAPSKVGSHLNYANPHFSDVKNLPWIMALDGPVLGKGKAIHRHGTVPELQRLRPADYTIVLPGTKASGDSVNVLESPVDGNAIAAKQGVGVKSRSVKIGELHPSMEAVIKAVAKAAKKLKLPKPVITSGNDSKHSRNSLHYANRALDFRGRNITRGQGFALDQEVSKLLGPDYDVIFETFSNKSNNHLHVEYDPR